MASPAWANVPETAPGPIPHAYAIEAELAQLGAICDAENRFPHQSLALLARHGALALFADSRAAPQPARLQMDWLRLAGRGDLSVGRIFEGHVNAVQLIDWYGTAEQRRTLHSHVAAGKVYGVWATEPPPGVRLTRSGDASRLDNCKIFGCKIFASGAGHIDFAIVTAQSDGAHREMVVVPTNDPARSDCAGWNVRGMRATMSGRYDLTDLSVTPADIIGTPGDYDREPRFTAGAWRFLAVHLGGVEALVKEMRATMSDVAKADPLQRLKFADAVEAMRTAQFWVAASARKFDRGDADAPAFVQMARGVVERCALDVMTDVARVIGTRSAFDGRIDKVSRDLSLYLRQAGPDHARDRAALAWLDRDICDADVPLW